MMWTQAGDTAYMMGGAFWNTSSQTFVKTAEVWALSLSNGKWTRLEDMAYPVSGGAAVFNAWQNEIVVWGGNVTDPHSSYSAYSLAPSLNAP